MSEIDLSGLVVLGAVAFSAPLLLGLAPDRGLRRGDRALGRRHAAAAGLPQATSPPFVVAASTIGIELELLDEASAAALVAAGLLSVLLFPFLVLTVLRREATTGLGPATPGLRPTFD